MRLSEGAPFKTWGDPHVRDQRTNVYENEMVLTYCDFNWSDASSTSVVTKFLAHVVSVAWSLCSCGVKLCGLVRGIIGKVPSVVLCRGRGSRIDDKHVLLSGNEVACCEALIMFGISLKGSPERCRFRFFSVFFLLSVSSFFLFGRFFFFFFSGSDFFVFFLCSSSFFFFRFLPFHIKNGETPFASLVTRIAATSKSQIASDCNRNSKKSLRLRKHPLKPTLWTRDRPVLPGFYSVSEASHRSGHPPEIVAITRVWFRIAAIFLAQCDFCDCDTAIFLRFLREKLATSKLWLPIASDLWLRLRGSLSSRDPFRKTPIIFAIIYL